MHRPPAPRCAEGASSPSPRDHHPLLVGRGDVSLDRLVGEVDLVRDGLVPLGELEGQLDGGLRFDPVDLADGHVGFLVVVQTGGGEAVDAAIAGAQRRFGARRVAADAVLVVIAAVVAGDGATHAELTPEALLLQDGSPRHRLEVLAPELALGELVLEAPDAEAPFFFTTVAVVVIVHGLVLVLPVVLLDQRADALPQAVPDVHELPIVEVGRLDLLLGHVLQAPDLADANPLVEGDRLAGAAGWRRRNARRGGGGGDRGGGRGLQVLRGGDDRRRDQHVTTAAAVDAGAALERNAADGRGGRDRLRATGRDDLFGGGAAASRRPSLLLLLLLRLLQGGRRDGRRGRLGPLFHDGRVLIDLRDHNSRDCLLLLSVYVRIVRLPFLFVGEISLGVSLVSGTGEETVLCRKEFVNSSCIAVSFL
mmetsp:Transcript_26753/g.62847  ORF Transcript_26753/g.62847 Transcript_26753/m.62847 type:complete len:422 (+) Transcript_26753:316-1581(+)